MGTEFREILHGHQVIRDHCSLVLFSTKIAVVRSCEMEEHLESFCEYC
jgi:hypothetical protein